MGQRLDSWLSECGRGSRKECRDLVRRKRVTVDGVINTDTACQVSDEQVIRVNGEVVTPPIRGTVSLIMHKPCGYACSDDQREAPIIGELLTAAWQRCGVNSVGRLDRDTSGLLLLTNDGQLLHRLIHPKRKVPKRYRITYSGTLASDAVLRCQEGLSLDEDPRPCRPAELTLEGPGRATIILHEGRYHQVRRMIAALGARVEELHRDRFGALDLPADLQPGMVRAASDAEMELVRQQDGDPV